MQILGITQLNATVCCKATRLTPTYHIITVCPLPYQVKFATFTASKHQKELRLLTEAKKKNSFHDYKKAWECKNSFIYIFFKTTKFD